MASTGGNPLTLTSPLFGITMPNIASANVVFPAPLEPTMALESPAAIWRLTPLMAVFS